MKLKQQLIIFFVSILFCGSLFSQNRVERPIQVQVNFSGAFLKAFGNILADSEVDHLEVSDWVVPGVSVGYHYNKLLYIGYAYTPSRGLVLKESWGFGNTRDGNITVNHATGHLHNLELRVSPFEIGFYGQVFYNHIPKVDYSMDFQRKFATVVIGENEYETDLQATWNFKKVNALGIGFGYNWVNKKGISVNLGLAFPIIQSPFYKNIKIVPTNPAEDVLESDLGLAKLTLENETFYFPVQFTLNVGYNFQLKKEEKVPSDRF